MPRPARQQPMTALDYLFMIGGPLAFLLVAVLGVYWIIGPAPPDNPIQLIKDHRVAAGMSQEKVLQILGEPKSVVALPDGGERWEYHHGTADPFVEEDGDLVFSPGGILLSATVSRSPAPVSGAER